VLPDRALNLLTFSHIVNNLPPWFFSVPFLSRPDSTIFAPVCLNKLHRPPCDRGRAQRTNRSQLLLLRLLPILLNKPSSSSSYPSTLPLTRGVGSQEGVLMSGRSMLSKFRLASHSAKRVQSKKRGGKTGMSTSMFSAFWLASRYAKKCGQKTQKKILCSKKKSRRRRRRKGDRRIERGRNM
jgi:hypothetical protein